MYVDHDNRGEISIHGLTQNDAEVLADCICSYLSQRPIHGRTDEERHLVLLKTQLEKEY